MKIQIEEHFYLVEKMREIGKETYGRFMIFFIIELQLLLGNDFSRLYWKFGHSTAVGGGRHGATSLGGGRRSWVGLGDAELELQAEHGRSPRSMLAGTTNSGTNY